MRFVVVRMRDSRSYEPAWYRAGEVRGRLRRALRRGQPLQARFDLLAHLLGVVGPFDLAPVGGRGPAGDVHRSPARRRPGVPAVHPRRPMVGLAADAVEPADHEHEVGHPAGDQRPDEPGAGPLDALALGEDGARSLGFDLGRVRLRMLLGVAIGVGGAVAVSGSIGFVGLIVPHLVRPLTDRSPSAILLPSMLGGAVPSSAGRPARRWVTSSAIASPQTSGVTRPWIASSATISARCSARLT